MCFLPLELKPWSLDLFFATRWSALRYCPKELPVCLCNYFSWMNCVHVIILFRRTVNWLNSRSKSLCKLLCCRNRTDEELVLRTSCRTTCICHCEKDIRYLHNYPETSRTSAGALVQCTLVQILQSSYRIYTSLPVPQSVILQKELERRQILMQRKGMD